VKQKLTKTVKCDEQQDGSAEYDAERRQHGRQSVPVGQMNG